MKKSDWKVLLICAVIGVVTAVVTGRHLYQGRHEFVQAQARIAFGNALQDYLQKWKDIDVFVSSPDGYKRLPNDSIGIKKEPVKVTLTSEYGEKVFEVPVTNPQESGSHIYRLEKGVYFNTHSRLLKRGGYDCTLESAACPIAARFPECERWQVVISSF